MSPEDALSLSGTLGYAVSNRLGSLSNAGGRFVAGTLVHVSSLPEIAFDHADLQVELDSDGGGRDNFGGLAAALLPVATLTERTT